MTKKNTKKLIAVLTAIVMAGLLIPAGALNEEDPASDTNLKPLYTLTVINGKTEQDEDQYYEGAEVTVTAEQKEGKRFVAWTWKPEEYNLQFTSGGENADVAVISMPPCDIEITATYEDLPQETIQEELPAQNPVPENPPQQETVPEEPTQTENNTETTKQEQTETGIDYAHLHTETHEADNKVSSADTTTSSDSTDTSSRNSDWGTDRAPGTAPDGSVYNPNSGGDTDKSGLVAVSGSAQGPSFNILNPVKTEEKANAVTNRISAVNASRTSLSASSGPTSATSTDDTEDTDTEKDEETDTFNDTVADTGGYNVVLVGVKENNTKSETWNLLLQKGIVFEDFQQGEGASADTDALLQVGMDGARKDEDSGYWNSPAAASDPESLITQFGFYGIMGQEQKETDAQVLGEAISRLTSEGLTMNARNMPFFMEIQLTGNNGEDDSLARLISELNEDGLSNNTVLIFFVAGTGEQKAPLILVHPEIQDSMTIKTPLKSEDILATILTLSGNASAGQYAMLGSMPGKNLLTVSEFEGIEGLVPEPPAEEETKAEQPGGTANGAPESFNKFKEMNMNGTGGGGIQEKNGQDMNRWKIDMTKVTTNSGGSEGPGSESDESFSAGPGGAGASEPNLLGPAAENYNEGQAHP